MRAALLLANDMAKNNFVSTRGSDGSTPTMRYNSQNSRTTKSAEMVAAGQTTVDVVVATWIKSAGAYLYSDLSSSASTTSTTAPSCASTTGCWTWPTRPVSSRGRQRQEQQGQHQGLGWIDSDHSLMTSRALRPPSPLSLSRPDRPAADAVCRHLDQVVQRVPVQRLQVIGPGYAYDKTKTYKHYWVLDFANAEGESCHSADAQVADYSTKMLNAVNAKRAEKGLTAVCINTKLAAAAQVQRRTWPRTTSLAPRARTESGQMERLVAQNLTVTAAAELVGGATRPWTAWWLLGSVRATTSNADYPFIGPGYKYDKTKQYKH
ncbi:hypothetical protein GQ600_12566 [Phytophthora cactorum]|nr:hypothetical protein GQ600_12566 [Phytophthora cactorum]